jgi:hypothetical protein
MKDRRKRSKLIYFSEFLTFSIGMSSKVVVFPHWQHITWRGASVDDLLASTTVTQQATQRDAKALAGVHQIPLFLGPLVGKIPGS